MSAEVLQAVPEVCGARFSNVATDRTFAGKCGRVRNHLGPHFEVVLGFIWTEHTAPRRAWPGLDAGDLTIHFDCDQSCFWAPRSC